MITIQILGLDQFVVGHYSREHTANIAQLFEVEEDQVSFYAPGGMMFHLGMEQTSWDTLVVIRLPEKFHPFEEAVTDYIFKTLTQFSINVSLSFDYFEEEHFHQALSDKYPRFISPDQIAEDPVYEGEEEGEEEEECDDPTHHHVHVTIEGEEHEHIDPEDEESIYLGNAFEGFEEMLEEASKNNK